MMVSRKAVLWIATWVMTACSSVVPPQAAWSQMEISPQEHFRPAGEPLFGGALFSYDVFNFACGDSTKSRLDVYICFANDVLQFVKLAPDSFSAAYEVHALVYDRKKNLVASRSRTGRLVVRSFAETNSWTSLTTECIRFELEPQKYQVAIGLTDMDTRKTMERQRDVELREFTRTRVHMSDIVFADTLQLVNGQLRQIVPNLLRAFGSPKSQFKAYCEVYPPLGADSVEVSYEVFDSRQQSIRRERQVFSGKGGVLPLAIDLRSVVQQPGRYELAIQARSTRGRATVKSRFAVQWGTLSFRDTNIDLAIEQLRYVARKKDIDAMLAATPAEREMLFEVFWRRRDPTPGTERNELREEFFRRVDFANRQFTVLLSERDGWRTDRGRIYIIYGPPTEVEREPTQLDSPAYEIWYYRHLNRRFLFADRNGTGDYQLVRSE
ncbi:MAG: GWxTD domain-containing protein [bacterium]|jgi:GWxTD domain-containing protein|nr:GWxTD domain-containing protein [candidate division KSB1 bacterium]MDH7559023.1 GWxTD domain-containing protein [bacterium]